MRFFWGTLLPALILFALCFALSAFSAEGRPLRPSDLIASPQNYLNRTVEIEIVEPLSGPPTLEALARVEYGKVPVEMPDARFTDFSLVPAGFRLEDPNRYKLKFDRVIQGPLRVKGEFLSDDEISKSLRRPVYVIRVASWEPLARQSAQPLGSLAELKSDPPRWDRKRVVYEGIYENRFEVSALDKEIWLSFERNAEIVGKPAGPQGGNRKDRVRVTGLLFTKQAVPYGHLGAYKFEMVASKVEYLGAAAP